MIKVNGEIYGCPVEALSSLLGKKWVAQIIWTIGRGEIRYGELCSTLDGASKKMVSQQLTLLMDNGIIENNKVTYNNQVESTYFLTPKGLSLLPVLKILIEWGNENLTVID